MTEIRDRMRASPRDAGHVTEGSNPEIAYTIGGLRVSVPNEYTGKVARGAASEMLASAHLMAQGYHVFRALAATCPVDLIAWRAGEDPLRVEVKSATQPTQGHTPSFSRPTNDLWDLLAVVNLDGSVALIEKAHGFQDVMDAYLSQMGLTRRVITRPTTHCMRGHEFTYSNTYVTSKGSRSCKTCRRRPKKRTAPTLLPLDTATPTEETR